MKLRWIVLCLLCLAGCNLSIDPTPIPPAAAPTKTLSGVEAEFVSGATPDANNSSTPGPVLQITSRPQSSKATATATTACVTPTGWNLYTVKRGDTLSTIATRASTTLEALVQANCLSNPNALKVGQSLLVPPAVTATPR